MFSIWESKHIWHLVWCYLLYKQFNSLPDDKILDWSKLKQTADNILKCIQNEK